MKPLVFVPGPLAEPDPTTTHRCAVIAMLLLVAMPFMQFGLTYWLSVQGAAFWVVALFVQKRIGRMQMLLFTVIAVTMLLSLVGHLYADSLFYSFLRIVRQILSLYLIVCAAVTLSWRPKPYFFDVVLPIIVVGLSGLVILQYLTYTFLGWSYFFIPAQVFIQGLATLADSWLDYGAARGFLADVRAAGTYSEPSYFGFVALGLAMLVLRGIESTSRKALLLGIMMVALLCSKSASGVVLYVLLVLFAVRKRLTVLHLFGVVSALTVGLIAADVLLKFPLFERLINITDPVLEPSGYTRLVLPFKHIALVLQYKPLGVPLSEFFTFTSRHIEAYSGAVGGGPVALIKGASSGTDNGFLNLFLTFGVGGFVIVGLMPFIVRDKLVLVFLLFAAQFNGDIFSPDKAALIALVISCRRIVSAPATGAERAPTPQFTPPGPFGAMVPRRA